MENILLKDFVAKAISSGANLRGCLIQCSRHQYKFTGLDDKGRVEILYGKNFEMSSRLNDDINVHKCYLSNPVLQSGVLGSNRVLILDCNNPHRS